LIRDRALTGLAVAATVATALLLGQRLVHGRRVARPPAQFKPRVVSNWSETAAEGIRTGPQSARVTLGVFTDYLCEPCALAARDIASIQQEFPQRISVVWHQDPWRTELSRSAAIAAICSHRFGKFLSLSAVLFGAADSLGLISWSTLARKAGIRDTAAFKTCLSSEAADSAVSRDRELARSLHIDHTPALLVDSLLIEGYPGARYLRALVRP